MGHVGQNPENFPGRRKPPWKWNEVEAIWSHPEMTAAELHDLIPAHTVEAIRKQRTRIGRFGAGAPTCCRCDERPVWSESARARRWGLCKGCFLDEERRRLEEQAEAAAVRQLRKRVNRAGESGHG